MTTKALDADMHPSGKMLVVLAVDEGTGSMHAITWAKDNFIHPEKHAVYLLSVTSATKHSGLIFSTSLSTRPRGARNQHA